ncbi:hypothetical protein MSAN_02334100 [Mycena sanguinolenta]|uniref:Uncharacterized protein n=1 Tax=Mycena sanguinolenta TaxID=230812 RepID=A0A8H6X670_9AGAR|nr:hypothetical protein MSAN_02334100 [Mycena sanguinolenta]
MSVHTDVVRAIGIFKAKRDFTIDEINATAVPVAEAIRNIPIIKANLTKYEVSYKSERLPNTLAKDLGLNETPYTTVIIMEATSHEKIREALTHPDYKAVIAGALEHATTLEHFHFFSAEYMTVL